MDSATVANGNANILEPPALLASEGKACKRQLDKTIDRPLQRCGNRWNSMSNAYALIRAKEKLTSVFGGWPSFHDAEVLELNLSRGNIDPETEQWLPPSLIARALVLGSKRAATEALAFSSEVRAVVTLRFKAIDDLKLEGFNHLNEILSLDITVERREEYPDGKEMSPRFAVTFKKAFGLNASFKCGSIEVTEVAPCALTKAPRS